MKKITVNPRKPTEERYAILFMRDISDKEGYVFAENERLVICIRTAKLLSKIFLSFGWDRPIVVVAKPIEGSGYRPILTFMNTDTAQHLVEQPTDQTITQE